MDKLFQMAHLQILHLIELFPTAQEVSQMNAGTQLYHIVASNAYHKDTEDFYIS